jgi:hypothetical protein
VGFDLNFTPDLNGIEKAGAKNGVGFLMMNAAGLFALRP